MKKRLFSLAMAVALLCAMLPHIAGNAEATAPAITTAKELAERAIDVAQNYKTLYVMGGWGAPLTASNKNRLIQAHAYNQDATRRAMIYAASSDTFAFDCVCFVKGLLWGWDGTLSDRNGGAVYGSNGVPDVNTEGLFAECTDVSTDFSSIEIGELLWMYGHVGIYIGDGLAVECTPSWKNCVQITTVRNIQDGVGQQWTKHGKLPYVQYCEHRYDSTGFCSECGIGYKWRETFDTGCAGTYQVACSDGICLRTERPYDEGTERSELIAADTQVHVLGSVSDHTGKMWYQVEYAGVVGYCPSEDLTWLARDPQQIQCDLSSPAEGAIVPQSAYPVKGTVVSKYPLREVVAYIDGEEYARVTPDGATLLEIQPSVINYQLNFAALAPGKHTLEIKACDIYNGELVSVCLRNFVTEGEVACAHTYITEVTTPATCLTEGVLTSTCSQCGDVQTQTVAATGHHYQNGFCTNCAQRHPGDITCDGNVNNDDVVLLLWHVLFPVDYPIGVNGDLNGSGQATNDDVVMLLWHTLFPEEYPLQ